MGCQSMVYEVYEVYDGIRYGDFMGYQWHFMRKNVIFTSQQGMVYKVDTTYMVMRVGDGLLLVQSVTHINIEW